MKEYRAIGRERTEEEKQRRHLNGDNVQGSVKASRCVFWETLADA